jgi:hypothetical protein
VDTVGRPDLTPTGRRRRSCPGTTRVPAGACTLPTAEQPLRVAEYAERVALDVAVPAAQGDVLDALVRRAVVAGRATA